jgi:hypothetical protein
MRPFPNPSCSNVRSAPPIPNPSHVRSWPCARAPQSALCLRSFVVLLCSTCRNPLCSAYRNTTAALTTSRSLNRRSTLLLCPSGVATQQLQDQESHSRQSASLDRSPHPYSAPPAIDLLCPSACCSAPPAIDLLWLSTSACHCCRRRHEVSCCLLLAP